MAEHVAEFVVIGGWARSGKDTAAEALVDAYGHKVVGLGPLVLDLLKKLDPYVAVFDDLYRPVTEVIEVLGYETAKASVPDFMRLMQQMCLVVRDQDPRFLARMAMRKIRLHRAAGGRAIVLGLRDPEEVAYFREEGALSLWIDRPGIKPLNAHPAETCADPRDYDIRIKNDGTIEDLHKAILAACTQREFWS